MTQNKSLMGLLDDYAEDLRTQRPSGTLDSRMEAAIAGWAEEHRSQNVFRRPWLWVAAAASIAVITGGVALLALGQRNADADEFYATRTAEPMPVVPPVRAISTLATGGQVSLFPAEGAVFRVKANLASAAMRTSAGLEGQEYEQEGGQEDGEKQYWVDVRISNDGTMRIMQVLPAERGRVVPYETP